MKKIGLICTVKESINSKKLLLAIFAFIFSFNIIAQDSSDIPSKDKILNYLSKFKIIHVDNGHFVEINTKITSKGTFYLEDKRLVVRCKDGYETYLDLSDDMNYCIWSADSKLKGNNDNVTWQFDDDVYAFQSFAYDNCHIEKGTIWFDTTASNAERIKRSLKLLYENYTPKN